MESVVRSGVRVVLDSTRGWRLLVRQSSSLRNFPAGYHERPDESRFRRRFVQPTFNLSNTSAFALTKRWSTSTSRKASVNSEVPETGDAVLHLSSSCVKRLKKLQSEEPDTNLMLRIGVEGGGCSGFQYNFTLDHKVNEDDRIFEKEGAKIVVDTMSLDFIKGATIDWSTELIRSAFRILDNPKAEHGCSCGSSFSVKI